MHSQTLELHEIDWVCCQLSIMHWIDPVWNFSATLLCKINRIHNFVSTDNVRNICTLLWSNCSWIVMVKYVMYPVIVAECLKNYFDLEIDSAPFPFFPFRVFGGFGLFVKKKLNSSGFFLFSLREYWIWLVFKYPLGLRHLTRTWCPRAMQILTKSSLPAILGKLQCRILLTIS